MNFVLGGWRKGFLVWDCLGRLGYEEFWDGVVRVRLLWKYRWVEFFELVVFGGYRFWSIGVWG